MPTRGRCVMGRETAIQKLAWTKDDWLCLDDGINEPKLIVEAPNLPDHQWEKEAEKDDFNSDTLNINFQSLRVDISDLYSLSERPGYLRLRGGESLSSYHKQALLARRQQAFVYTAETCVDFQPENFQQLAGLICLYDNHNFYYLNITHDEELGRCIDIIVRLKGEYDFPLDAKIPLPANGELLLKAEVNYDKLRFFYATDKESWNRIGSDFDASNLSDEFDEGGADAHFTGAFVGICCQDLSGLKKHADFDYFEYREELNS